MIQMALSRERSMERLISFIQQDQTDYLEASKPKSSSRKVVALVGESGRGKSTIIRLIDRFCDPSNGSRSIDEVDIKRYNLKALRSHIALVSQELYLQEQSIRILHMER